MAKINFKTTKNERIILEALWDSKEPLTRSGILDNIKDKSFNENSFYRFLNGLMDKGLVEEDEIVRTGKSYGRTYKTTISKNEYDLYQMEEMNDIINPSKETGKSFILNMIEDNDFDEEDIEEIEKFLEEKKAILK